MEELFFANRYEEKLGWRNWQTRQIQGLVVERPWEFKSPSEHKKIAHSEKTRNALSFAKEPFRICLMKLRTLIHQDEDGIYVAECPALPGCVSQGKTRQEAIANIKEAIEGYVESLEKHQEPIPPSIDEEVVDIAI